MTGWLNQSPPGGYPLSWVHAFDIGFIDLHYDGCPLWMPLLTHAHWIMLGIGSLLFLCQWRRGQTWLLVLLLVVVPFAALAGVDLLWGGMRSTMPRYLFPCHLGIMLASVIVLIKWVESPLRVVRVGGWSTATLLIAIELASAAAAWHAESWWHHESSSREELAAIRCINESKHPLIFSGPVINQRMGYTLALAYHLGPQVRFQVISEPEKLVIPDGLTDVYFINVSDDFRRRAGSRLRLEPVPGTMFWRCCN
jgi:uncharacterized membrane protein